MSDFNGDLSKLLNLATDPPTPVTDRGVMELVPVSNNGTPTIRETDHEPTVDNDITFVRDNMLALLKRGSDMFEHAVNVMHESESARSVEVTVQLLKALSEMNKDLLDLHVKKRLIKDPTPANPSPQGQGAGQPNINIDKAVFVGSTAELQKALKGQPISPPEQE